VSRILLVTPAPRGSRQGNRVTAQRWAQIIRSLGHRVEIAERFGGQNCDVLIALHARKSADSIQRFAAQRPQRPIVLALTGTDLYGDIHTSKAARRSLEIASRLVLLQPNGRSELPPALHAKTRVIRQSAEPVRKPPPPLKTVFEVCVSGHLRWEKDPFRAAMAARQLPADSKIRITHVGAALTPAMGQRAREEMERNPRYRWLGETPHWKARRLLARSRLLVLSSRLEGGANVVSEALSASVPLLCSRISGSVGLLGEEYAGFFDVGDTLHLAELMRRCESDAAYYRQLQKQCGERRKLVHPRRERAAWQEVFDELL